MKKRPPTPAFGALIKSAIESATIPKRGVANATRIDISTHYRVFNGKASSKGQALALITGINRLAGRDMIGIVEGMDAAGFGTSVIEAAYVNETVFHETVAGIIDKIAHLPMSRLQDVLAIVTV